MKKLLLICFSALLGGSVLLSSCSKEDETTAVSQDNKPTEKQIREKIVELAQRLPEYTFELEDGEFYTPLGKNSGFSFSDPNNGRYTYTSPDGTKYVTENNNTYVFTKGAFGQNASGGTVIAGSSSFNVDYTFCFSAEDDGLGLNFFGEFDGVSSIIGIAGDFEALQEGGEDIEEDPFAFFQGFVVYVIYDGQASGSYDVVNWFDNIDGEEDDLEGQAFAYAIDFQEEKLYFSSDGTLNVSGGSIGFNGEYLEISDFSLDGDMENPDFNTVSGFGTMGCN